MQRIPWRLLVAGAGGLALLLAVREHDARLRRNLELRQLQQQTAAQISDLRARAAAAQRDADAGARRASKLEAQRHQLERAAVDLKSKISNLKSQEAARLREVAALPFPALAEDLARQLGPGSFGTRDSGLGARGSESQVQTLSTGGNEDRRTKHEMRDAQSVGRVSSLDFRVMDSANSESPVPSPGLRLTDPGARAVASALIERDSCREQSRATDGLLSNCQEQAALNRAVIEEMNHSLAGLTEALRLKDEMQSRRDAAHRAELKAARGSRLRRFGRALQYVGAGVVIGVAVAQ